jgi:acid phosphatase family membrane protein YuiD
MMKELILSIAITWLFVKMLKSIMAWNKEKRISWKVLRYDGGMPSSHTAAVVSTSTALFLESGLSTVFVLSVILALIVMNDAMSVRWVTEEQSRVLNQLTKGRKGFNKLSEHVGHKPLEVLVGLILGIIIPIIIYAVL